MSYAQIQGEKRGNLHEEMCRVLSHGVMAGYDADEWDQSTTGPNFSLKTNRANLFKNTTRAHRVLIRTQKQITARWNSASEAQFTIDGGVPFEETGLEITDILIESPHASNLIQVYMT